MNVSPNRPLFANFFAKNERFAQNTDERITNPKYSVREEGGFEYLVRGDDFEYPVRGGNFEYWVTGGHFEYWVREGHFEYWVRGGSFLYDASFSYENKTKNIKKMYYKVLNLNTF